MALCIDVYKTCVVLTEDRGVVSPIGWCCWEDKWFGSVLVERHRNRQLGLRIPMNVAKYAWWWTAIIDEGCGDNGALIVGLEAAYELLHGKMHQVHPRKRSVMAAIATLQAIAQCVLHRQTKASIGSHENRRCLS